MKKFPEYDTEKKDILFVPFKVKSYKFMNSGLWTLLSELLQEKNITQEDRRSYGWYEEKEW